MASDRYSESHTDSDCFCDAKGPQKVTWHLHWNRTSHIGTIGLQIEDGDIEWMLTGEGADFKALHKLLEGFSTPSPPQRAEANR